MMMFGKSVYCCFCRVVMPADMLRYPELILCCDDEQRICIPCMRKAEMAAKSDESRKPIKRCYCGTVITLQTLYYLGRRFDHNRRQEQQNMQIMASWTRQGFSSYEQPQQRGMRSSYVFPPRHSDYVVEEYPEEMDIPRQMRPVSSHRNIHNMPPQQPNNHFRISERKHTPENKYLPIRQEGEPEMQKLSKRFSTMKIQQQESEIEIDQIHQSSTTNHLPQIHHQMTQNSHQSVSQKQQPHFFHQNRSNFGQRPKSANNLMNKSKSGMMSNNREPSFGADDMGH